MAKVRMARILAIGGSDSGGGAGIQADLKTIQALGGYGASAITAITVQNTAGVSDIHYLPGELISAQIKAVIGDIGADAVKIGMMGNAQTASAVVDTIVGVMASSPEPMPLVVDPVMMAASDHTPLLGDDVLASLKQRLFPVTTLVTPNISEAEKFSGLDVGTLDDMRAAAKEILAFGPAAVLVKGAHLPGRRISNLLLTEAGEHIFESDRIDGKGTHGTGCTLASAIATGLAQGLALQDAAGRAMDYVSKAIAASPGLGAGNGPLGHGHTVQPFQL